MRFIIAENQVRAGQASTVENVIEALKTHIDNSDVCMCACGAIWNMSKNSKKKKKKKKKNINSPFFDHFFIFN